MVWDDYYGKQGNPYSADDFRRILASLLATDDGTEAHARLTAITVRALWTEADLGEQVAEMKAQVTEKEGGISIKLSLTWGAKVPCPTCGSEGHETC